MCCLSAGGCGGANLGCSGTLSGGGLKTGKDEVEPLEQVDGGFGGAIGGGFKKVKSSSSIDEESEGGFGVGVEAD